MREFKVGDYVIWIDKDYSDWWKKQHDISLYGKIAKIIYIDKSDNTYLLEFKENIKGSDGRGKGKDGHCVWSEEIKFKSLSSLKLKKLLRR